MKPTAAVITLLVGIAVAGGGTVAGVGWVASIAEGRFDSLDERMRHIEQDVGSVRVDVGGNAERLKQIVAWLAGHGPRPQPARLHAAALSPATCTRIQWRAETTSRVWASYDIPCVDHSWGAVPAPWRSHADTNDSYLLRYVSGAPGCLWTSDSTREANSGIGESGRNLTGPPQDIRIHAAWRDKAWLGGGRLCSGYEVDLCRIFCG